MRPRRKDCQPRSESNLALLPSQVKTQVPKVPKQPLLLQHPCARTLKSSWSDLLEPEADLAEELPPTHGAALEPEVPLEGLDSLSLSHRSFVPLPPICSDSTLHSEDSVSHHSDAAGRLSPEHLSDEDTKSTASIFLTQVSIPHCPAPLLPQQPQRSVSLLAVAHWGQQKHRIDAEARKQHPELLAGTPTGLCHRCHRQHSDCSWAWSQPGCQEGLLLPLPQARVSWCCLWNLARK